MPRGQRRPQPLEDQLREFEAAPGVPKNLGNFPDELDTPAQRLRTEQPEPEPDPEPDAAASPEVPAAEPAGTTETEGDEPQTDAERRLAELETRIGQQNRELDFLRAGYQQGTQAAQPAAQPQPQDVVRLIDQYLGGFAVSEQDVQTILQDPAKGAEYLMNAMRAAIAAGANLALTQARAEFAQYQNTVAGATQLRDLFYGKHPDLGPYAKLVQQTAGDVRAQYPNAAAEPLIDETARRVRAQLKEWGVTPQRTAAAAPRTPRTRPAFADLGGGTSSGGGNGRRLSPIERQLREFEAGTNQYFGR